jgi:hypothetical protein
MENEVKILTVNDIIEQLSKLDPDLKASKVVFSYPNGESLGMVGIENITILKTLDDEDQELTMVSIGGGIEEEEPCDCEACQAEREMEEEDEVGQQLAAQVQDLFVEALWEGGLEHWKGLKYCQSIYEDKLNKAGLINGKFGE